jgi:teichuronic acid biosynthesis protein TuaE
MPHSVQIVAQSKGWSTPELVYRALLYCILVLLPFYRVLNLDVGVAAISVVDALIILGGLYVVGDFLLGRGIVLPDSRIALLGVAVFLAAILLSMVAAEHRGTSMVFLLSIVLKVILLYIAYRVTRDSNDVRGLIKCYLAGASVMGAVAIFQQLRNWQTSDAALSASGAFDARNEFTFYLAPGVALALVLVVYRRTRLIAGLTFGLMLAALVISRGRAGTLLALMGACAFIVLFFSRPGRRWVGLLLCGGLIFVVIGLWWAMDEEGNWLRDRYSTSFQSEIEDERGSTYVRFLVLDGVWRAWQENIWLGMGAGNFKIRSGEFVQLPFVDEIQPHNTYLGIMAELGILGVVGFLLILLPALWRVFSSRVNAPREVRIGVGLAYGIALAHLLTFDGAVRYPLWILAGMCYGLIHRGPAKKFTLQ